LPELPSEWQLQRDIVELLLLPREGFSEGVFAATYVFRIFNGMQCMPRNGKLVRRHRFSITHAYLEPQNRGWFLK